MTKSNDNNDKQEIAGKEHDQALAAKELVVGRLVDMVLQPWSDDDLPLLEKLMDDPDIWNGATNAFMRSLRCLTSLRIRSVASSISR